MSDFERLFPIGILKKSRNRELKPDFEKGEFFLADYLNKNLPKEWNIYTRPELKARWGSNQNKKTPDVVIAHPSDGIMIFEVKNWNISNFFVDEIKKIGFRTKVDIYQKNLKGRSGNLNPVDQVENYLWRMRNGIHDILEEIYVNNNKRHLIRCGIYFHNPYSTQDARNFVRYKYIDQDRCSVIARDFLEEGIEIEKIVPLINNRFKIKSDKDWLSLFSNWISPPLHRQEKQFRLSINDLDNNQKKYVESKPNVIQKISGVAGSGKTTIAALRAAISAYNKKKVLVLCYNITIKNFLIDEVEKTIYSQNELIDFFHFHDFCKAYRENNKISYKTNILNEESDDISIDEIKNHKEQNKDYSINYDVIIIDEGQDFKKNWYDFIRKFLNPNGEILIALDQKQNIYNREKKTSLKGIGGGRWGILKKSYRLLNAHIDLANKFSEKFLIDNNEEDEDPRIELDKNNQFKLPFKAEPASYWLNILNDNDLNDSVIGILKDLFDKKVSPSDIAILVTNHDQGRTIKEVISNSYDDFKIMDVFDKMDVRQRQQKILFKVHSDKLKMATIASFKGWDRRNILIITDKTSSFEKNNARMDFEFYTSMTRVREKVYILNRNKRYTEFLRENFEKY
tara:strand:+ start:263 stop:2137 length:1875 start_codon:yes stop_codon:yes gene_type:complete